MKFVPVMVTVVPPAAGPEFGEMSVTVGLLPTAITVPVSSERLGEVVEVMVTVTHGGGPELKACLDTASHAPLPLSADGFHQVIELPPFKLQFFITSELNVFPGETLTSKYSPLVANAGAATGSVVNCETVMPPIPLAEAVVPPLATVAVPVCVLDDPLAALVAPDGGGGGVELGGVVVVGVGEGAGLGKGGGGVYPDMFKMTLSVEVPPIASQKLEDTHDTLTRPVTPEGKV
uniref:hypothetical protein n=1 Tax=Aciditerrimonas ferrireducens TaxID=667306 RepID=UPI003670FBB7